MVAIYVRLTSRIYVGFFLHSWCILGDKCVSMDSVYELKRIEDEKEQYNIKLLKDIVILCRFLANLIKEDPVIVFIRKSM